MVDEEKKILDGLEKNASLFWNAFQHMFDVRERNAENRINFLLLISTFLPILSITLYSIDSFNNLIVLIPIVFNFLSIIILLKNFFYSSNSLVWFDFKITLNSMKEEKLYKDFFCLLKALESGTWKETNYKYSKIIKPALYLTIFSLFANILSVIFVFLKIQIVVYLVVLILFLFFCSLLVFYYKPIIIETEKENQKYVKQLNEYIEILKKNDK